tara:strand:+ start:173 stop:604 length:432 start_codon:yes stop_codon:yes gene_type:complete
MLILFNARTLKFTQYGNIKNVVFIVHSRDEVKVTLNVGSWSKSLRIPFEYYRYQAKRIATMLNPFPVYYVTDSTDCDHYRVTSAGKASNGWKYLKARDSAYEEAEGPTSVYRITKKEYDEYETTRRDYALEAFEDGHQHWVRR